MSEVSNSRSKRDNIESGNAPSQPCNFQRQWIYGNGSIELFDEGFSPPKVSFCFGPVYECVDSTAVTTESAETASPRTDCTRSRISHTVSPRRLLLPYTDALKS